MTITRRRFLAISASLCATGALAAPVNRITFRALGAYCVLTLPGGAAKARAAGRAVKREITAIEQNFSLWHGGSEVSRLNRNGHLARPSAEFRSACELGAEMWRASDGAFDLTMQPVWAARAAGRPIDWSLVGHRGLSMAEDRVRLSRRGMALTFNGMAQGIATDRAVAKLHALGYSDALADLGELHGLGRRPDGEAWRIGVAHPVTGQIVAEIPLNGSAPAAATSVPHGTIVRGHPHIVDPRRRPGPRWASVTVVAATAARADALSTAIAAAPSNLAQRILARGGAAGAVLQNEDGGVIRWRI